MNKEKEVKPLDCGIIMPISALDGCSAEHWIEVLSIIKDVVLSANFKANLVSNSDEVGVIQKRIIQNLYSNPIVICDVSGKNPNVMFELGMRLAFDKPTIIIKDDRTDYNFDTSVIEHLEYPRDLRFNKIVTFKQKLKEKIIATHSKATSDPNYSTFLKHFGEYKIAHLGEKEVTSEKYMLEAIEDIRLDIRQLSIKNSINLELAETDKKRYSTKLVKDGINRFLAKKRLKKPYEISSNNLEDELIAFLEKSPGIYDACEDPFTLREIVDIELLPF